jgi:hypothetical protein
MMMHRPPPKAYQNQNHNIRARRDKCTLDTVRRGGTGSHQISCIRPSFPTLLPCSCCDPIF